MGGLLRKLLPGRSPVVFEVGSFGVRAAQVVRLAGQTRVRDTLCIAPPVGNENERLSPDAAAALARRLVGQGRFVGRGVGLVLSPPDVHFHAMQVASELFTQPEDAIHEALRWEVAKELRAEADNLEVRYWPLPNEHRQGHNVMTVTMLQATALQWVEAFAAHGLDLRCLDVSPAALARAAQDSGQSPGSGLWLIADLGHRGAHITVLINDTPVYVRSIGTRGESWTEEIASTFDLGAPEAEALKRRHGLRPDPHADPALQAALTRALREPVDSLIHEVMLCCRYAAESYTGRTIERVVLAGGGAHLPGLAERMQMTLNVPVEPLRSRTESATGNLAGCLGTALRDVEAA